MKLKLSRTANDAARAITRHIESTYNVELHLEDCMKIVGVVQAAMDTVPANKVAKKSRT